MRKVVITGPESTGKSTLSNQLSDYFKVDMVKEYSRTYLEKLHRVYTQQDLTEIAKGQIELEDHALDNNTNWIICDTSLEVLKIWSEFKYNSCDPLLSKWLLKRLPDLYLLMSPDLPWEPDPLRENQTNRDELFEIYKNELISFGAPFYKISGNGVERFEMAKEIIKKNFLNK